MKPDEYQHIAFTTAAYPNLLNNIDYPICGLIGETGELAEQVKKMIRDDDGILTNARRDNIKKEAGDVLWYVAAILSESGKTFSPYYCAFRQTSKNASPVRAVRDLSVAVGLCSSYEDPSPYVYRVIDALERVCAWAGFSLEEDAQANLKKLASRQERGVIKGSGSDR